MEAVLHQFSSPWDFGEHIRGLRAVDRITIRGRPLLRIFRVVFPFVLLAFMASSVLGATGSQPPLIIALSLLPYVLIVALWFVLIFWAQFYLAARRTRQLDLSARGVLTRTFTADGFRIDGTAQAADLRWEGIHSAVETPEFLLIFINRLCAYYVPKRLIKSTDELQEVRTLLQNNLHERAHLLTPGRLTRA